MSHMKKNRLMHIYLLHMDGSFIHQSVSEQTWKERQKQPRKSFRPQTSDRNDFPLFNQESLSISSAFVQSRWASKIFRITNKYWLLWKERKRKKTYQIWQMSGAIHSFVSLATCFHPKLFIIAKRLSRGDKSDLHTLHTSFLHTFNAASSLHLSGLWHANEVNWDENRLVLVYIQRQYSQHACDTSMYVYVRVCERPIYSPLVHSLF